MWYDGPWAVRMGDSFLNLAQAHSTLALTASSTPHAPVCVTKIAEFRYALHFHIGFNLNLFLRNFDRTFLQTSRSGCSGNQQYCITSPRCHYFFYEPTWDTLYKRLSCSQLLSYKHHMDAFLNPHSEPCSVLTQHSMTFVLPALTLRTFASIPLFHFLNFSINNSSVSAIKNNIGIIPTQCSSVHRKLFWPYCFHHKSTTEVRLSIVALFRITS